MASGLHARIVQMWRDEPWHCGEACSCSRLEFSAALHDQLPAKYARIFECIECILCILVYSSPLRATAWSIMLQCSWEQTLKEAICLTPNHWDPRNLLEIHCLGFESMAFGGWFGSQPNFSHLLHRWWPFPSLATQAHHPASWHPETASVIAPKTTQLLLPSLFG